MAALKNWKPVFLATLAESPNVSRAARAAGIARRYAYEAREADPDFALAWDDAIASSVDDVEAEAFRRARHESDTLAIFLLKSHRREVYSEPKHQSSEHAEIIVRYEDRETPEAAPRPTESD